MRPRRARFVRAARAGFGRAHTPRPRSSRRRCLDCRSAHVRSAAPGSSMLASPALCLPACSRGGAPVRAGLRAALPQVLRAPAARTPCSRRVRCSVETRASACTASVAPALASAGDLAGSIDASCAQALYQLAVLDPAGAAAVGAALGPLFSLATLLFIVRCVCVWWRC